MNNQNRVAIVFPADAQLQLATKVEQSRFAGIAQALDAAGIDVVGAPYADEFVEQIGAQLLDVDGVLVWINPIQAGRDRSVLNAMLTDIASKGVRVSAHPEVIDKMGTKEVLYRTRNMGWGCDTRLYPTADAMRATLPEDLASGVPRVLKQTRGQSGDGVWKVELADQPGAQPPMNSSDWTLRIRHAKRGSPEERMSFREFLAVCEPYFTKGGGMIDQPYQSRLSEGMVRCYVVRDQVAGFGEQLVNALYPAPAGALPGHAPQPGPRLYFPPTRPDFQRLKEKLERQWIAELCQRVGLVKCQLPILWDADFLYGPKAPDGSDTFVLCEINVSSVYPFPEDALDPLVAATVDWIEGDTAITSSRT